MDRDSKVVAIIQARMDSTRLPGKVLLDIDGQPMLAWVVERTAMAKSVDEVVIATSTEDHDDPIADFCDRCNYPYDRGSEHDVLDRYYQAAQKFHADVIVRITADCPVIDPGVIDKTVDAFFRSSPPADFAANRLPPPYHRTYPIGLDTEVTHFHSLEKAWKDAVKPSHREHVMPYLYQHPRKFEILIIDAEDDYGDLRWTVDTEDDLKLIREVVRRFEGRRDFTWLEIVDLFERDPSLKKINADVDQKSIPDVDNRLK